ncbi:MAG TPA: YfiR/HmsC family protein [Bacteroidales bacterium]|nr:YfiR/HmsC family protein [Bacteroidales bacterium]
MKKTLRSILFCFVCVTGLNFYSLAQITERYQAISAYIFNFAKNVTWENEESIDEFHFLVIGEDKKIIAELNRLSQTKTIREKPITISSSKTLKEKDITHAHMIYVTQKHKDNIGIIHRMIEGKNILLVSDGCEDEDVIMINFYDSKEGTLNFEINKNNMARHYFTVMPDIILGGGNISEIKDLYYKDQQTLRNLQQEISTLSMTAKMLENNLENKSEEIKNKRDSLLKQTQELHKQQETLLEQALLINQQKTDLTNQRNKLLIQQRIFEQQSHEIITQRAELDKGKKLLSGQNAEIEKQKAEIKQQQTQIVSQNLTLSTKETELARQRKLKILFLVISLLIAALVATTFYAYWNKHKLNKTLEKKVAERTHDYDLANQQLERELAERKLAQEALSKSEERYRSTLDNMLEGGQIISFDYRYLYVNNAVAVQGRKNKDELLGHTMMEVYPGIEHTAVFPAIRKCIRENASQHMINEFVHADGSVGWFELSIQPVPEGVFILSYDITERLLAENKIKKLNEELEEKVMLRTAQLANANKELEAFAYSVSHDLRAPLRAINGFSKILADDYAEKIDDEGKRLCGIIQNEATRMGQLIDDLLAFSRLSRSSMQKTNTEMTEMVRQVFDEVKEQYPGHKIAFHLSELLPAAVDSSLIRQVWINYLSNALKFSSKKEMIEIEVGCFENKGEIIYFVKDNGAGFDMKYADKLFGVFQRLHNINEFYGTGVGLAIVQRIVNRHGGKVWAESEVDKGATFYFSIPLNP